MICSDLVLCQEGTSGETFRRAQNLQLPCIDVEWAIQCLITKEQLAHPVCLQALVDLQVEANGIE